jgi:hypothetical protein
MSVAIEWIIEQMDCYPTCGGQTDVVFNVHWRVNATDGPGNATSYGTAGVTYDAGSPYTPYADLTQSQVVGWVRAALGSEQVDAIENSLAGSLAKKASHPVASPALPWEP